MKTEKVIMSRRKFEARTKRIKKLKRDMLRPFLFGMEPVIAEGMCVRCGYRPKREGNYFLCAACDLDKNNVIGVDFPTSTGLRLGSSQADAIIRGYYG